MKNFFLLILCITSLLACSDAQVQSSIIVEQHVIDLSQYPIAKRLYESDGKTFKEEYTYFEHIEIIKIIYLSDGLKVSGWIAKPKGKDVHPAIIWNRGGNQEFGALDIIAKPALFLGKLASEGYYVIASNYRGNVGGEGKEEFGGADVNDVLRLIDIIDEAPEADNNKIGMWGWSRGGMMTYISLTKTDRIKAAVVGGAVSDKIAGLKDRPEFERLFEELIPNYTENREAELIKRSAIYWVDKFPTDVPILMLHGTSDWRVKPAQSLRLALEFDKHRIPYRLIMYEGGDHGISEFRSETHAETVDWFHRFLKDGEELPDMEYHGR